MVQPRPRLKNGVRLMWKQSNTARPIGYDPRSESTDASPPASWAWLAFATLAVVVAFALLAALPFLPPKERKAAPREAQEMPPAQK